MIYISSSAIKSKKIGSAVRELADFGFRNIELSGGTKPYDDMESDLLDLQKEYGLNYMCHNYFPPPHEDFVLNLCSADDGIRQKSVDHILRSFQLSTLLGAKKFAFHAGFYFDIPVEEIGKPLSPQMLNDVPDCYNQFVNLYRYLASEIPNGLEIYVENNVLSSSNKKTFDPITPFMLVSAVDYLELKDSIDFNILLDLAHLKVSCNSLDLDFESQAHMLIDQTDYIHISNNDGLADTNSALSADSDVVRVLSGHDLADKTITIEVYDNLDVLLNNYDLINSLVES